MMDNEPVYGDIDENGNPLDTRKPKYTRASTEFQKRILGICGRKHFRKGEKGQVILIERTMISLHTTLMSKIPTEWVEHCIEWATKLNTDYIKMTLPNLVKYINNEDKRVDWVARYIEQNKLTLDFNDDVDDGLMEVNFE